MTSFPKTDQRRQISTTANGGAQPHWSRDGKELYYLDLEGKLIAVDMAPGAKIEPGIPHALFDTHLSVNPTVGQYAVDGTRFLLQIPVADARTEPITVMLNWTAALEE